ncbi:MAG: hypothetical protein KDD70_04985 [Bdellovibrionales bacterium]|nr:hypothetical protein [Bdellovibrionales bacterium]
MKSYIFLISTLLILQACGGSDNSSGAISTRHFSEEDIVQNESLVILTSDHVHMTLERASEHLRSDTGEVGTDSIPMQFPPGITIICHEHDFVDGRALATDVLGSDFECRQISSDDVIQVPKAISDDNCKIAEDTETCLEIDAAGGEYTIQLSNSSQDKDYNVVITPSDFNSSPLRALSRTLSVTASERIEGTNEISNPALHSSYRSASVIIQNDTQEELTISGFAVLQGVWQTEPSYGDDISPYSSKQYELVSNDAGVGVQGYLRLQTQGGFIAISFRRPWVGKFQYSIGNKATGVAYHAQLEEIDPADSALVITLEEESL